MARRSAAEWSIRGALAVAAVTLGYVATTRSAGYVLRTADPARAHALAPGDGRVTALYAQAVSGITAGSTTTLAERDRADGLARQALRQDPTAVAAVSTLGLDTQVRGDTAGARRLFAYAERLSRRDLWLHVWSIEDAVSRGDVAGALRHYDLALRTSRSASDLLFPVLASAIAEAPVRAALVEMLARQPAWGPHFMGYVAGERAAPLVTARLFAELRHARLPVADAASVTLIHRLVGANLPEEAWSYYASIHPGADRSRSRDPNFAADPATASPFDWYLTDAPALTISVQRGDRGGVVDFAAPPGIGGTVMQQMQMLPAGRYRLDGGTTGIDQPEGSRPYWSLACRDGRELGTVAVPSPGSAGGAFSGTFVVPAGCPVQTLSLVIRASDATAGATGQIVRAQLAPVG